ncbi:MAG: hypothetical protein CSYNP_03765 [Syntrophus sp. SKADARSKE-3]|nr:hypothetical protein [Syntrophus sp. SKADARSKE-3]
MYKRSFLNAASVLLATSFFFCGANLAHAGPGAVVDTVNAPGTRVVRTYYANSPAGAAYPTNLIATGALSATDSGAALRKFVDSLPGLGSTGCTLGTGVSPNVTGGTCNQNNLGSYIPVATPDVATYPGSDFYTIALKDYTQQMHQDLPKATQLRGYVQMVGAVAQPQHYLGPLIIATKYDPAYAPGAALPTGGLNGKPTRILFQNTLTSTLFLPIDTTVMGSGAAPTGMYSQMRAAIHLHGGHTPWISDGTPHQWITPATDTTTGPRKGLSFQNVPDMVGTGKSIPAPAATDGLATYFWSNEQSSRLMFYHDHTHGITRLNVYAGEAAGYLIVEPAEDTLIGTGATGSIPGALMPAVYKYGIPLVIQDKTFVPANVGTPVSTTGQDTLWSGAVPLGMGATGDLWMPHVYEPSQEITAANGLNPAGRWDYGPWVWPPSPATLALPVLSITPEAFMDTPVVNGAAYPYLTVEAKAYRFRVLNAANDRSLDLQLYQANGGTGATATAALVAGTGALTVTLGVAGSGYTVAPAVVFTGGVLGAGGTAAKATATINAAGAVTGVTLVYAGSGYTTAPTVNLVTGTEVAMLPAIPHDALSTLPICAAGVTVGTPNYITPAGVPPAPPATQVTNPAIGCWPETWPTDGRIGGVPDPTKVGPQMIRIGTESGFLPSPVVYPNTPINFDGVGNIASKTLLLQPAERADVIIDFTGVVPGTNIILYNDAPAALPGGDPRYDYFTGIPDQTPIGGAPSTLAGFGPNTRTMMQFRVVAATPGTITPVTLPALTTALTTAYNASQPAHIVPANVFAKLTDTAMTVNGISIPLQGKSVNEGFDATYGRINAMLGTQAPNGLTPSIPLEYASKSTENLRNDQVQLWKITHNGIDTHPIHFHLTDVQVVNRIDWTGQILPPDPDEMGWKETVQMNRLQDVIVA